MGFWGLYLFTSELGSKEDYAREFKDTPFGLLVRKVAKLDHEAAMQAFSKFINDESLNAKQIAFVQKVIHYIEQNGYVESKAVLMKPPFDQPILFTRLFDGKMGGELMETIDAVRKNAVHVTALYGGMQSAAKNVTGKKVHRLYNCRKRRYSLLMTNIRRRKPWTSASCTTFWYCAKK